MIVIDSRGFNSVSINQAMIDFICDYDAISGTDIVTYFSDLPVLYDRTRRI